MKIKYILPMVLMVLLMFSLTPAHADASDLEGNSYDYSSQTEYTFTTEDDSFTGEADSSMDISYTFTEESGSSNGVEWIIAYLEQSSDSAFQDASYDKGQFELETISGIEFSETSVSNVTMSDPDDYESMASFFIDTTPDFTNTADAINTTAILGLNPSTFVQDPNDYIGEITSAFEDLLDDIDSDATTEVTEEDLSLEYTAEGTIEDLLLLTDISDGDISDEDYNEIDIEGGFTLSYSEDGALDTYEEEWTITYEDVTIIEYSTSMSSGGFLSGISSISAFGLPLAIVTILAIPVIRRFR